MTAAEADGDTCRRARATRSARTRFIEVVPAGPSRLHSSAPPRSDEPPVVLHPLWAPVHARRADRTDTRGPLHRAHVLHPGAPPRHGPRPGRRPRPVVPFDIPVEAFAVEVGGGAHPSVRSLGERRLVYVEHRRAVRRSYRRRQLFLAVGLSSAFVAVAGVALATGGLAEATRGRTVGPGGRAVPRPRPVATPPAVSRPRRWPRNPAPAPVHEWSFRPCSGSVGAHRTGRS